MGLDQNLKRYVVLVHSPLIGARGLARREPAGFWVRSSSVPVASTRRRRRCSTAIAAAAQQDYFIGHHFRGPDFFAVFIV